MTEDRGKFFEEPAEAAWKAVWWYEADRRSPRMVLYRALVAIDVAVSHLASKVRPR